MTAAAAPSPPAGAWADIEYPLDIDKSREELSGLSLRALAELPFSQLAGFTGSGRFPEGAPTDRATFYSPHDSGVHIVEAWVHMQVEPVLGSLEKNMYGFDDPLLASIVRYWCDQPGVLVIVNLDHTQLAGRHSQEIMALFRSGEKGNSVAIGDLTQPVPASPLLDPLAPASAQSAPGAFAPTPAPGAINEYMEQIAEGGSSRGAISHLKLDVINRRLRSSGSTNQSESGEERQDNELTIDLNLALATQASTIIGLNHRVMQAQMERRLERQAQPSGGSGSLSG